MLKLTRDYLGSDLIKIKDRMRLLVEFIARFIARVLWISIKSLINDGNVGMTSKFRYIDAARYLKNDITKGRCDSFFETGNYTYEMDICQYWQFL